MSILLDENFETIGYENTWEEIASGSNIVDENSALPVGDPPIGSGNQCLRIVCANAANPSALAINSDVNSNQDVNYVRFYFYFVVDGLSDGQGVILGTLRDSSGNLASYIQLLQVSGNLFLRYAYYSSGSFQFTGGSLVVTGQWYRVECQYDITGTAWEWRVDGASKASGSLSAAMRTPYDIIVGGVGYTGASVSGWYLDQVTWDDAAWIGVTTRLTRNTRAFPLGERIGMGFGMGGRV